MTRQARLRPAALVAVMALWFGCLGQASSVVSLDGAWLLATDPENKGREQKWFSAPRPEAKQTKVPWIIQDAFPGYHGVAWYWRDFQSPARPHPDARFLLRFWQVDYKADVWLNDVLLGSHEGGESPFLLDATDAIKPGAVNRLAVRVLNPTHQPIDGIVLNEVPHRNKALPYNSGSAWDQGGIWDSVELLIVPALWVEDLHVTPDWRTGRIHVRLNVRNASTSPRSASLSLTVAPAAAGETLEGLTQQAEFPVGDTILESDLQLDGHRLWQLDDPFLYRVTARLQEQDSAPGPAGSGIGPHELSTRCGFRDFRFDKGAFRLNGKRIYLRSSHTGNCCPIGLEMPHDPDYLRRDLINQKMMRFNAIRFIAGVPKRYQLDLADEIGLLVYEESYAAWLLADSPRMKERYNESVFNMIKRDRNHPSVAIWGLLNETSDGPVFRHAASVLPALRKLDDSRVVLLNSGRFDNASGVPGIQTWRGEQVDPCITKNVSDHEVKALGIKWAPGEMSFHPGPEGQYATVRWTAPADNALSLKASFHSIAEAATTDVHVLHNGSPLFDRLINLEGQGPAASFSADLAVNTNDTIDFVCGFGNQFHGADSTALAVVIKSAVGTVWDCARDFSAAQNPAGGGTWSYGALSPGPKPDAKTFTLFKHGSDQPGIGSISNPGSLVWEDILSDQHPYQRVPHTASVIHTLRTLAGNGNPVWLSEYGIGSAIDLPRVARWYEQLGKTEVEDAQLYKGWLDKFLADWERYRLAEVFSRPEDFFAQSIARMGAQRLLGINAIRSNPNVIGHSLTGTLDQGMTAEGVWTTFRELKPGATDALFDAWAPLRFCLFAEPTNSYRRRPVRLEAALANEDVLAPGEYPIRLQVVGPGLTRVFDKSITITIGSPDADAEPPMVLPIFSEEIAIDGPPGAYRFLATFEQGAAAAGGEIQFFVDLAPEEMPGGIDAEVALLNPDEELAAWLAKHGIKHRPYEPAYHNSREVILVSGKLCSEPSLLFPDLANRMARGSTVIFLTADALARGDDSTGWLPLKEKGRLAGIPRWLYHADDWSKHHAFFDGLPTGGIMDYAAYRDLIPDTVFMDIQPADDSVAGSINASWGYHSGLLVGVYKLGAGQFVLNALHIRENLGSVPQADRLLVNMLRFAAEKASEPPAEPPADFDKYLKSLGY